MNSDRTQAYGRIVKTLEDLGPAKLLATEQVRIRDAADTLIFASSADHDVMAAVEDVRALADHLVESERWTEERAAKLLATEQVRIRDAADTLIFASGADHDVMAAVEDVRALTDHLVESDRWTEERAAKLVDDLGACGPLAPVG